VRKFPPSLKALLKQQAEKPLPESETRPLGFANFDAKAELKLRG